MEVHQGSGGAALEPGGYQPHPPPPPPRPPPPVPKQDCQPFSPPPPSPPSPVPKQNYQPPPPPHHLFLQPQYPDSKHDYQPTPPPFPSVELRKFLDILETPQILPCLLYSTNKEKE